MDDLKQLLDDITTLDAVRSGNRDLALFRAIVYIGTGPYLIVPRPLRAYGLTKEEAASLWAFHPDDEAARETRKQQLEDFAKHVGIPRTAPEPERIVTKYDAPTTQPTRTPFQKITRRLLRR